VAVGTLLKTRTRNIGFRVKIRVGLRIKVRVGLRDKV
jgi:hypothetical protein